MNEVEAVARAVAPMMEGGREFDQMPPTRLELRQWSRSGMCSTNDATQDDATELAQTAIAALDAARGNAEPVAWMYIRKPEEWPPANPVVGLNKWKYDDPARPYWIETPLYAHPPAPDAARGDPVARLIAYIKTIEPDEETAGCPATWADFIQILEGIAEAGEPFNG